MARRNKPKTPEQIAADKLAKRVLDLEAVNLQPDGAQTGVYVIGPDVGPQKVGLANDAGHRLGHLQVGCPFHLKIHFTLAIGEAARNVELEAHRLLAAWHRRGEWFDVTPQQAISAVMAAHKNIADCPAPFVKASRAPAPPKEKRISGRISAQDGLVRLHSRGSITFEQLEAGLAYRKVRRVAACDPMVRSNGPTMGWMNKVCDAVTMSHKIEGAVVRVSDVEGLTMLRQVAFRGDMPEGAVDPLKAALNVVAQMLAEHTAMKTEAA